MYIYIIKYIYIYNKISLERGPQGEWGPLLKEIVFNIYIYI